MKLQIKKDIAVVSVAIHQKDLIDYIQKQTEFLDAPDDAEFFEFRIRSDQTGEIFSVSLPIKDYFVKVETHE